ncbi:MAG: hypothetical protein CMN34_05225 [Saprospirales bacterium]|nr:hypothetical protein [Saprospirales bacterium]
MGQLGQWMSGMKGAIALPTDPIDALDIPSIGVVLPVRNEVTTLPKLLDDLAAQTLLPREVLIVNDASDDGTPNAVSERGPWPFTVRLIDNPSQGKKAGLSAGIAALNTHWAVGVDADTRLDTNALEAIGQHLAQRGEGIEMALLPLRIANASSGTPHSLFACLQALDFAAMQGWAISAVRRGKPAMASGGGWVWRRDAFPHDRLRPEIPSGDDVFSLAALLEDGKASRVDWIGDPRAMVSAAAMPDILSLLDQRIRWGTKATQYPKVLKEASRVAWTIALLNLAGVLLLILNPWMGLLFWSIKSSADMAYTHRVGQAFGLLPDSTFKALGTLLILAFVHPFFIATTLLLMPFRNAQWKGRSAT